MLPLPGSEVRGNRTWDELVCPMNDTVKPVTTAATARDCTSGEVVVEPEGLVPVSPTSLTYTVRGREDPAYGMPSKRMIQEYLWRTIQTCTGYM